MKQLSIITNNEIEGYDLITNDKSQDHDGDKAGQVIATIYEYEDAILIKKMIEDLDFIPSQL